MSRYRPTSCRYCGARLRPAPGLGAPGCPACDARVASHACPTCKRTGVLSALEARRGYQCADCTRRDAYAYGGPMFEDW